MDEKQRKQILWNIVNSLLAGALVLLGACSSGEITLKGLIAAFVAGSVVAITKFKTFWEKAESEYSLKLFSLVGA